MKRIAFIVVLGLGVHGVSAGDAVETADLLDLATCDQTTEGEEIEADSDESTDKAQPSASFEEKDSLVIGHLQGRSHKITIYAEDGGERYSVYDMEGHLLGEQLDAAGLHAAFPELHEIVEQGIAGEQIMMLYDRPVHVTTPVLLHNLYE